jgi:hypothetical protein
MGDDIKVKLKLSREQANNAAKIVQAKLRLVEHNIAAILKSEAIPHLIDLIMVRYDELGEKMESMADEDPTNPAIWRGTFKDKLEEEAEQTFIFDRSSGVIRLNLGEKAYLGYSESPDTDSNQPLVWMVYYLEGLKTSWAWITRETWEEIYPEGKWDPSWGRFKNEGSGFMLSGRKFHRAGNDWMDELVWSEVRHPFSTWSPDDIFQKAMDEFLIRPFIQKAVDAAMAGKKL